MTSNINFCGFIDYRKAFAGDKLVWTIIGTVFFIVTFVSFIPETMEMMVQGTNYGLSLWFVFGNSFGQWLLVINFICLHYEQFLAIFRYNFATAYPDLLVFIELFAAWMMFLPVIYLTIVVDDREHTKTLTKKEFFMSSLNCIGLVAANVFLSLTLLVVWGILGTKIGFNSDIIKLIGDVCGYISFILEIIQYIPQYVTTIRIRDNGSLSLLMLEIQGPAALLNGLYMAVARGEAFSTYATSLADAALQIGLIIICACFKLYKYIEKDQTDYEHLSSLLLQPIVPVR